VTVRQTVQIVLVIVAFEERNLFPVEENGIIPKIWPKIKNNLIEKTNFLNCFSSIFTILDDLYITDIK
jgi:hypothetical protein